MMRAGTLFSGIGAPECASRDIEWRWAAEIDPFACAVHKARFPGVPNMGNVMEIDWHAVEPVDLVVGGPPCQDYSVAGQRASLSGARGDLTLQYARILDAIDPAWSVTENVPGWLSTPDNAFGAFLGILVGADAALVPGRGQRWTDSGVVAGPRRTAAWRILDAQYFGVPQRRRRVFVVAVRGSGDFRCAAALFPLRTSVQRDTAPRRATREDVTPTIAPGSHPGGISGREAENGCLIAFDWDNSAGGPNSEDTFMTLGSRREPAVAVPIKHIHGTSEARAKRNAINVEHGEPMFTLDTGGNPHAVMTLAIRGRGDSHDLEYRDDGIANAVLTPNGGRAGIGVGAVAVIAENGSDIQIGDGTSTGAISTGQRPGHADNIVQAMPLAGLQYGAENYRKYTDGGKPGQRYPAIAVNISNETHTLDSVTGTLAAEPGSCQTSYAMQAMSVRRLTPRECARLQGFPDDWCAIEYRGKPAADGPMYRAYGNSMAVPCIGWVLRRVQVVHATTTLEAAA
jgi:DNA (cytosine-5)-methyltransferase 1